jgi:hypothetical protein
MLGGEDLPMPLVKCKDCGNEFSDRATACPKCASPNVPPEFQPPPAPKLSDARKPPKQLEFEIRAKKKSWIPQVLVALVLAFLLALVFVPGFAESLRDRIFGSMGFDTGKPAPAGPTGAAPE